MNDAPHTSAPSPAPDTGAGQSPTPEPEPSDGGGRFFNRDTSWLEFNRRVLAQATDARTPLLERVKFLAIFANNLDEFFMKRIGLMKRRMAAGVDMRGPDGMTPREAFDACRAMVVEMQREQARCWEDEVRPALAEAGVRIADYKDLDDAERARLDAWFASTVFPVLTPLAVDPGHRFPFISNLSENLGVVVAPPGVGERRFARIKIPDVFPRLVPLLAEDERQPRRELTVPITLVPLEQIITANLDDLFPGMTISEVSPFRVTRSAAVEVEDEDVDDLLEHVEAELHLRRFASAVRLEMGPEPSPGVLELVRNELGLTDEDVYCRAGPLEYGDMFPLADLPLPELREPVWAAVTPPRLRGEDTDIFRVIRERDVLVHHPYESFRLSVERFIHAAARDPDVLAIKQTIYRTSRDSPFVTSLIRAAEEGKAVACLVELRARFDEQRNVRFARQLEQHGVHVAYGVVGLKTHCKCSLVVRREDEGIRAYAHLGTGNYNPATAQLYTDLGVFTANPAITDDVVTLFNELTGRAHEPAYKHLLVAPHSMRAKFEALIDAEIEHARAGRPARIWAKINSMEDRRIAEKLYEASSAGVEILLVVRGFCCLRPGVPGLSERIRVISVVGRFLEHSRIFHFAQGRADPLEGAWYTGSADWMYRNLNNRVEAIVPILDPEARARLFRLMDVHQRDGRNAWEAQPDGRYQRRRPLREADADAASPERLGTFVTMMRDANSAD